MAELNLNDIKPSSGYKNSVSLVIFSIITFLIIYLILLTTSGILCATAIYYGVLLISAKVAIITIAIGGGLIALGIMFFFFLIKFIFSVNKDEDPYRIEIKKTDQPELFDFLEKLSVKTNTKFPKKVFFSPDVNASVFYNSSFWSLFLPVRKNLNIGLGLVNSLNKNEFEAVIAHEYGHFSQKSMALGSYVYIVNKTIYNMVYEYDSWDKLLENWANTGGFFGLFAHITYLLADGVRYILKAAYSFINLCYLKLSREMEFHADNVAALISGKNNLVNALRKIEFASLAYDYTTEILDAKIEENKASNNIYKLHYHSTCYLAELNKLIMIDNQVVINDSDYLSKTPKSRINIKDMWASHPSILERKNNLEKLECIEANNNKDAWSLISNKEKVVTDMTKNLYHINFPDKKFDELSEKTYLNHMNNENNNYEISKEYKGYYNNRPYPIFINENSTTDELSEVSNLNEIYTDKKVARINNMILNENDLNILEQIKSKTIRTKLFEFDGEKYKRRDAKKLIEKIKEEILTEKKWLEQEDKKAFSLHLNNAKKNNCVDEFINYQKKIEILVNYLYDISDIHALYENKSVILYNTPRWTESKLNEFTVEVSNLENRFRKALKKIDFKMLDKFFQNSDHKNLIEKYINNKFTYISISNFNENNFLELFQIISNLHETIAVAYNSTTKDLTDFQLENV